MTTSNGLVATARTTELTRSVAAHGIPGALTTWPEQPLDDASWRRLMSSVCGQRLSGLLVEALGSGSLPATQQQLDEASEVHFERVCGVLQLESEALLVLDALSAAGVEAKVLKGSATAHLDYPDPAQRLFADVDLLVRAGDIDEAVKVLTGLGQRRHSVQPRAGFDRRFGKGATFTAPTGHEFDLHRTFVMGPYGLRLRLDDLWEQPAHFTLAGRQVGALDIECRFLHSCYHAALGDRPPRLVPQRDIAQILLSDRLDLRRVDRLMRSWQAEPVVARAVTVTWESLRISDITALSTWAKRYVPRPRAEKDLAVYIDDDGSSYAAKSVAALAALPGARQRAAFLFALALPRRGFGTTSGKDRWRRALQAAAHRAPWTDVSR